MSFVLEKGAVQIFKDACKDNRGLMPGVPTATIEVAADTVSPRIVESGRACKKV